MNLIDILSSLKDHQIVAVSGDEEMGTIVAWNLSSTLRIFSVVGDTIEEVDVITLGGDVPASPKEARQTARRHLAELEAEMAG